MFETVHAKEGEKIRIMMSLLESVERDGGRSQRRLASELGIALGLVNAYLKRCTAKGLVKVKQAPAQRYAYYLTPHGFAEKSRLTAEYLSYSFSFFRHAKSDCRRIFEAARARDFDRVVLAGRSDLAEIAAICAIESRMTIVAVVETGAKNGRFVELPVAGSYDQVVAPFDAVVITALNATQEVFANARERFGADRVLVPDLLRSRISDRAEARR